MDFFYYEISVVMKILQDISGEGEIMGKMKGLPKYLWIQNTKISSTGIISHQISHYFRHCLLICV